MRQSSAAYKSLNPHGIVIEGSSLPGYDEAIDSGNLQRRHPDGAAVFHSQEGLQ
jgi:hypothetical protein